MRFLRFIERVNIQINWFLEEQRIYDQPGKTWRPDLFSEETFSKFLNTHMKSWEEYVQAKK